MGRLYVTSRAKFSKSSQRGRVKTGKDRARKGI